MEVTTAGNPAGAFIWYELMTSDADAAARFYGDVVDWTIAGQPDPKADMDYRMINRDDGGQSTVISNSTRRCRRGRWAIIASSITVACVWAPSCSATMKAGPRSG